MTKRKLIDISLYSSLIVLAASTLIAYFYQAYSVLESDIILFFYGLGDWLYYPMLGLTQLGSPWLAFGLSIALIIRHHYRLALRILLAGAVSYAITTTLKFAIGRPRPFIELGDLLSREISISGFGFPSGHTGMAAAIAFSLWFVTPSRLRPLLILWPVVVGVTRMYLGVHSPLDVVGGFAAGLFAASLQQKISRLLPDTPAA